MSPAITGLMVCYNKIYKKYKLIQRLAAHSQTTFRGHGFSDSICGITIQFE